ncbi:MAG: hypothetical protein ACMUJM_24945, partial [bacterium]
IETKANILKSQWLQYSLMEHTVFIERITQKKFREYITFHYSGENLKIEPVVYYKELYDKLKYPREQSSFGDLSCRSQ